MESAEGEPSRDRTDRLENLLREPTLLPLWLVVVGHLVVFIAPVMLLAFRDGRGSARGVLVMLVAMSGFGIWERVRARRRLGLLEYALLGTWALAALAAWFADHSGIF